MADFQSRLACAYAAVAVRLPLAAQQSGMKQPNIIAVPTRCIARSRETAFAISSATRDAKGPRGRSYGSSTLRRARTQDDD